MALLVLTRKPDKGTAGLGDLRVPDCFNPHSGFRRFSDQMMIGKAPKTSVGKEIYCLYFMLLMQREDCKTFPTPKRELGL